MATDARTLIKVLTSNDLGLTGGHQAGIHVPLNDQTLSFFPRLDEELLNPRRQLAFLSSADGRTVTLSYIHYNGKLSGVSTRNEYRLTGLTKFLREHEAAVGDHLELTRSPREEYSMRLSRSIQESTIEMSDGDEIVLLSGTWKTIRRGNFL